MNDNQDQTAALDLISQYVAALQDRDSGEMDRLRSPDFLLDLVAGDAFNDDQLTETEAKLFWPSWFSAFSGFDYQVSRTITAGTVVVTEWRFLGTNSGKLDANIFGKEVEPTGRTIQFRGVSVYEIKKDQISRETLYMDLATLWVELGVSA